MSDIDNNKLIAYVEKMPAFPKSVQQIVLLTSDNSTSAKDIVKVIEADPVMIIKILKIINSPFYGLGQKTTSLQRAVVHIGLNTIKNLALSIAAIGVLKPMNKAQFNARNFLLHSLTTASICRMLAERLEVPLIETSDFFVAGLLHDFGKIVFAEYAPVSFKLALEKSNEQKIALNITEKEFLGINHAQAGKLLAEHWELDDQIISAIEHHHDVEHPKDNILNDCVFVANQISKKMQFGFAGNPNIDAFPDKITTRFELSLDELICDLGDLSIIEAEALSFIHL